MCKQVYFASVLTAFLVFWVGCQSSNKKTEIKHAPNVAITSINQKFAPLFSNAEISFPADSLIVLLFKKQQLVEVWASDLPFAPKQIISYPLVRENLEVGPKTSKKNKFPEGIYSFETSPQSFSFPNNYDRSKANADNRSLEKQELPLSSFLKNEQDASELVSLIAAVGYQKTRILIAPTDFRVDKTPAACPFCPNWYTELYDQLRFDLAEF